MIKGIDVSKYQGEIDWQKVKQSGVEFVMLRAGYGKYENQKDEFFESNYKNAKAVGIKVGAYHYSYAKSVDDAKREAETLLNWIDGKKFEYPIALDVEEDYQSEKGMRFVSEIIKTFCSIVEQAGYYVCIYANKYWLDHFIDDECKSKYDTWVAQWAQENTYSGDYGIWQYSSEGCVDGIVGRVDMNNSYKDYSRIMAETRLNGFAAEQEPQKVIENENNEQKPEFSPKMMISLFNTELYVSSDAKKPSARKTGTFYIYDGIEINGRYRITNTPERALKKPVAKNVTGFVNKSDLK